MKAVVSDSISVDSQIETSWVGEIRQIGAAQFQLPFHIGLDNFLQSNKEHCLSSSK